MKIRKITFDENDKLTFYFKEQNGYDIDASIFCYKDGDEYLAIDKLTGTICGHFKTMEDLKENYKNIKEFLKNFSIENKDYYEELKNDYKLAIGGFPHV